MIYVWKAEKATASPLFRQEDLQWLTHLAKTGASPLNKALKALNKHRPTAMQTAAHFIAQGIVAWEQREDGVFIWADDPKKAQGA